MLARILERLQKLRIAIMDSEKNLKAYKQLILKYSTAIENGTVKKERNPILYKIASVELAANT